MRWLTTRARHADRSWLPALKLWPSDLGLRLQDLPAAVLPGLQVDVVRATALAAVLVLDVRRRIERVRRPAVTALHPRHFTPRYCHGPSPTKLAAQRVQRPPLRLKPP